MQNDTNEELDLSFCRIDLLNSETRRLIIDYLATSKNLRSVNFMAARLDKNFVASLKEEIKKTRKFFEKIDLSYECKIDKSDEELTVDLL